MSNLELDIRNKIKSFKKDNNKNPSFLIVNPMVMGALVEEISESLDEDFYLDNELSTYLGLIVSVTHHPNFDFQVA